MLKILINVKKIIIKRYLLRDSILNKKGCVMIINKRIFRKKIILFSQIYTSIIIFIWQRIKK